MGKLIRMDLYRMPKSKAFIICLILAFVLALAVAPLGKVMFNLANSLSSESVEAYPAEVNLSDVLSDPFPVINLMLVLLSLCFFFYADVENGYIKNIAGQMPMKGFTVLSKFIAAIVHNLVFAAVGIIGLIFLTEFPAVLRQMDALFSFVLFIRLEGDEVLLLQLQQKLFHILMGASHDLGQLADGGRFLAQIDADDQEKLFPADLLHGTVGQGLKPVFGQATNISKYMPDVVMSETPLDTLKALAVAIVTGGVFLLPAIRIFDRKDVK